MNCNCKWCEAVIAVIILLFAYWPTLFGVSAMTSKWIVVIAAIVLLIHSFVCKRCMMCDDHKMSSKKKRL